MPDLLYANPVVYPSTTRPGRLAEPHLLCGPSSPNQATARIPGESMGVQARKATQYLFFSRSGRGGCHRSCLQAGFREALCVVPCFLLARGSDRGDPAICPETAKL